MGQRFSKSTSTNHYIIPLMPRLFIIAGHSHQQVGATGNGLVEATLTIDLRNLITTECRLLGATVINDDDNQNLAQVIAGINAQSQPNDLILDLHFNAGAPTDRGVEAFVALDANNQEHALATALCALVSQILGTNNRGVKPENQSQHSTLGILHPPGINVLLEIAFISNKQEISRYLTLKQQIAARIAHLLVPIPQPVAVAAAHATE